MENTTHRGNSLGERIMYFIRCDLRRVLRNSKLRRRETFGQGG